MNTAKETLKYLKSVHGESIHADQDFKDLFNSLVHKVKKSS